jgi:hypothetical protein
LSKVPAHLPMGPFQNAGVKLNYAISLRL